MTEILEIAIAKAKDLPLGRQDEVGQMVLAMIEQDRSELSLSKAQQEEVRRRIKGPTDWVPEAEMNDFFRKLTA